MRRKVMGFTLIELMIVVAIIAIIAAIAIPGLLRARISANEGSASAGMRSLASAQTNYMKSTSTDQDNDGTGEFGVFNELCGATNRRGNIDTAANLPALTTTDLSVAFETSSTGFASKSGYYFQIYIPGEGAVITDTDPVANPDGLTYIVLGATPLGDAVIQQQENRWVCYAWPATYRSSGVRAFVVDQGAEVFASANTNNADNTGFLYGDINGGGLQPDFNTAMTDETATTGNPTPEIFTNIGVKDNTIVMDTNHTWLPSGS